MRYCTQSKWLPTALSVFALWCAATGCHETPPAPPEVTAHTDTNAPSTSPDAAPASAASSQTAQPSQSATTGPVSWPTDDADRTDGSLAPIEEGFRLLSLEEFDFVSKTAGETSPFSEPRAGLLRCVGSPRGYLVSRDTFTSYEVRFELRYVSRPSDGEEERNKSNSGLLIHVHGPAKVWPACIEAQGRWFDVGQLKTNGGLPPLEIQEDLSAREAARRPLNEWQKFEVTVDPATIVARWNDREICRSTALPVTSGHLGLQAEEFPYEIRDLRMRPQD